jgi:hypothetical protein
MGNSFQRSSTTEPPLPAVQPQIPHSDDVPPASAKRTPHSAADPSHLPGSASSAVAAIAASSSVASPAPSGAPSVVVTASTFSAIPPSSATLTVPLPSVPVGYPWRTVMPVVAGSSLLLGAGLAYGISYGGKQAARVEVRDGRGNLHCECSSCSDISLTTALLPGVSSM